MRAASPFMREAGKAEAVAGQVHSLTHTHTNIYTRTHTHTHIYTHIHTHTHTHTHTHLFPADVCRGTSLVKKRDPP